MLKPILIAALLLTILRITAHAQTSHRDSIKTIAKADSIKTIAKADTKNFRLTAADWKNYKMHRNKSSDYFKPSKGSVSDTLLLRDSLYVKTYRNIAFYKTSGRHPAVRSIIISVGSSAATVLLLAVIAHALTPGKIE